MRGVAVLLVVVHHAWPAVLPGGFLGVDVFFTVSGFVIGTLLLDEVGRSGTIDLYGFWTRRARRILPASLLVLAVTLCATWSWAPASERDDIGDDGLWASLFAANLRFMQQGVDYATAGRDPSPFLHYWSLAVEEQFYLVIPVVLTASAVVARRSGWSARKIVGAAMLAVCIASLACSILLTAANSTTAYYSPLPRAGQLAAGVAAACVVPMLARHHVRWRQVLAPAGALGLVVAVVVLDEDGLGGVAYPSYLSLAPTVATVAILLAGAGSPTATARALSFAPLRRVGDVSYSLYLWHWPVLVVAPWLVTTGPVVNALLVLVAYGLAELTYRLVEDPVRRSSWLARRRSITTVVAMSSIGLATACANEVASFEARVAVRVGPSPSAPAPAPAAGQHRDRPVTEFVAGPPPSTGASGTVTIDADDVLADYPDAGEDGCQKGYLDTADPPDVSTCTFGSGGRSVYVIGDSMATALSPAVLRAARGLDVRVTLMARASCTLATGVTVHKSEVGGAYRACDRFRESLLRHLERVRPDAVVMVNSNGSAERQVDDRGRVTPASGWMPATTDGLVETVRRLESRGIAVVLVENPAKPGDDVDRGTACLLDGRGVEDCGFRHTPSVGAYERAYRRLGGEVPLVRVNTHACPGNRCVPVVGDLVVWRDDSHFTASFATTLAPAFSAALRHVLPPER
jgi:peptidoglycan/LPS O-acetylase OafA/YrhL